MCQWLSAHTLIQTHSTHTLGRTSAGGSILSCFILPAAAQRRDCAQTWLTGRWNVPGRQPISVALDTDVPPCDARTGFHWRKTRGSVRSKYNQQRQQRSRGAITGWKMLKIVGVWRRILCKSGNVDIVHVYSKEVCYLRTHQETPAGFLHKIGFFVFMEQTEIPPDICQGVKLLEEMY